MSPENMRGRCNALLTALGIKNIDDWWHGHNLAFGRNPIDVPLDEVYRYLMEHSSR
jgi:hypothetical protein